MKKYALILFGLIIASHSMHGMAGRSWNSYNMIFAGQSAFGKDWIFRKAIDTDGLQTWQKEFAAGLNEIKNYASKLKKRKRDALNKYVSQLERANDDLVNNIKIVYNSMFSPGARKLITSAEMKLNKKIELRPLFDKVVKAMADLKLNVMAARKKTKSADELAAYDIIDDIAQVIINVARTASKSVDYLE